MKTVIEMAREAGLVGGPVYARGLERFAELIRADERNSWPSEMEAMERYQVKRQDFDRFADEIIALQKALAEQPAQQEPVAYLCENAVGHKYFRWKKPSSTYKPIALYTSPPAQRTWVGLTDADWKHLYDEFAMGQELDEFAEAIEAKLKEKNT